ncbi:MAG: sigma-70 family RNA polymerase sigma factor [Planctomycetota bacterium]
MNNDLEVLDRFRSGDDPEALAVLVDRYREMVYAVCRRRLGPTDAEDAAQETFLKLVRNPGQVQTSVCSWLHTVATTTAVDWGRRETRALRSGASRNEMLKSVASPEGATMDESELRTELDQALADLDEPFRMLVVEHFLGGRTQSDLAAEQGCSVATISRRISKAVDLIKDRMSARGYATATASGLAALLSTQAVAADLPSGLTLRILSAAGTGGGSEALAATSSTGTTATSSATAGGGLSLPGMGVFLPVFFGLLAVIGMGIWLFLSPSSAPPSLQQTPPPAASINQQPPTNPLPDQSGIRVGWIMDDLPSGEVTTGTPAVQQVVQLATDDRFDVVLLLPRQISPEFEGIIGFMASSLDRRYFDNADPLSGLDVVVIARAANEGSEIAARIWSESFAARRSGVGTVLLAPELPDTPEVREIALTRESIAFHHPQGHGQRMPATVVQPHPILDNLPPGTVLDVCACGAITEVDPEATVLALRDTAGLPVAEQAAAANLGAAQMPLLMIHDPVGTDVGRRVVAPMNNYAIKTVSEQSEVQFLKQAILWAGRQPLKNTP